MFLPDFSAFSMIDFSDDSISFFHKFLLYCSNQRWFPLLINKSFFCYRARLRHGAYPDAPSADRANESCVPRQSLWEHVPLVVAGVLVPAHMEGTLQVMWPTLLLKAGILSE